MFRLSRRAVLAGSVAFAAAPRLVHALAVAASPGTARDIALAADAFLALGGGFAPAAGPRLASVLANAGTEGLDPAHYLPGSDARSLAYAVAQYANDLGRGRIATLPNRPDIARAPPLMHLADTLAAIAAAADPAGALAGLAPVTPLYLALKAELVRTQAGDWPDFTAGPTLNPGTRDPRIAVIRVRLAAFEPTLPPSRDPELYDPILVAVARRFQAAHGLDPDGRLGRYSQAALAEQPAARAARLAANMDAGRAPMPPPAGLSVEVNVPAYHLVAAQDGQEVLAMKVVLGRPTRPTPLMQTRMTGAVFNPPWGVPQTLAKEDMLPRLRADPNALTARGFRLYGAGGVEIDPTTVDWRAVRPDRFPYVLRQDPGEGNALGRVKFNLVNNLDIYMHDTPDRRYFATDIRAFSSGCIRLERPMEMLDLLMAENNTDRARLQAMLDRRTTSGMGARRPIPTWLVYRSAGLDSAGNVVLRPDIYRLDAAYAQAMAGTASAA